MPAYKYATKEGKTLWYCSFHYVDWMGQHKRKKKKGFSTRKEALEWERMFLERGVKDPDILFGAFVQEYLEDKEERLKPTTMIGKRLMIEKKILPYFEKLKLSDITPIIIRKWQNELKRYRDEDGKPYSPTYLRTIHSQMSAMMNYAVKYYQLSSNPCIAAGPMGDATAEKFDIWTREEYEHFLTFVKKERFRCAFNILFYTGMREGELLALTPEDIPEDRAVINVNKNYAVVEGRELLLTPKTKRSQRVITIHEQLHRQIREYIDGLCLKPDERIFFFKKSGLLSEFKRRTAESGNTPIRLHYLRHSHASMLIEMGVPIGAISERLGHESPDITLRVYAHLYPGKHEDISNQIGKMFDEDSEDLEDI